MLAKSAARIEEICTGVVSPLLCAIVIVDAVMSLMMPCKVSPLESVSTSSVARRIAILRRRHIKALDRPDIFQRKRKIAHRRTMPVDGVIGDPRRRAAKAIAVIQPEEKLRHARPRTAHAIELQEIVHRNRAHPRQRPRR